MVDRGSKDAKSKRFENRAHSYTRKNRKIAKSKILVVPKNQNFFSISKNIELQAT